MDLTGKTIGPYVVEKKLGQGGMGAVFKARHRYLNRMVALKVLPPELASDTDFAARFLREGQAVAALEHPNIVPIYEAGEQDGYSFLAMRFIDGQDLAHLLAKNGRMEPGVVVGWLEQAAAALDAAHEHGIVHRDIKPGNMMIEGDKLYLTDFGIAKRDEGEYKTRTGMVVGTPEYMAPEQLQGLPIDGRADVYALGVVAYQMLTGSVPFSANTPAMVIYRKLSETTPDVRSIRPELLPDVGLVVAQAMAAKPDERFMTAGAFVRALKSAVSTVGGVGYVAPAPAAAPQPWLQQGVPQPGKAPFTPHPTPYPSGPQTPYPGGPMSQPGMQTPYPSGPMSQQQMPAAYNTGQQPMYSPQPAYYERPATAPNSGSGVATKVLAGVGIMALLCIACMVLAVMFAPETTDPSSPDWSPDSRLPAEIIVAYERTSSVPQRA